MHLLLNRNSRYQNALGAALSGIIVGHPVDLSALSKSRSRMIQAPRVAQIPSSHDTYLNARPTSAVDEPSWPPQGRSSQGNL